MNEKIGHSLHWIMAALLALSYFSVPRFKLPHSKHGRATRSAIILYEKNGCHVSKLSQNQLDYRGTPAKHFECWRCLGTTHLALVNGNLNWH
jgi:hypothetical protein